MVRIGHVAYSSAFALVLIFFEHILLLFTCVLRINIDFHLFASVLKILVEKKEDKMKE